MLLPSQIFKTADPLNETDPVIRMGSLYYWLRMRIDKKLNQFATALSLKKVSDLEDGEVEFWLHLAVGLSNYGWGQGFDWLLSQAKDCHGERKQRISRAIENCNGYPLYLFFRPVLEQNARQSGLIERISKVSEENLWSKFEDKKQYAAFSADLDAALQEGCRSGTISAYGRGCVLTRSGQPAPSVIKETGFLGLIDGHGNHRLIPWREDQVLNEDPSVATWVGQEIIARFDSGSGLVESVFALPGERPRRETARQFLLKMLHQGEERDCDAVFIAIRQWTGKQGDKMLDWANCKSELNGRRQGSANLGSLAIAHPANDNKLYLAWELRLPPEHSCSSCFGFKKTVCSVCRGRGSVWCGDCKGHAGKPCNCRSNPRICFSCQREPSKCGKCKGKGRGNGRNGPWTCDLCSGSGICHNCNGKGKLSCNRCFDTYVQQCRTCSNRGSVPCPVLVPCRSCD